ncbi:hypothetical protein G6011_11085 [Alternaria panax]|uniref:Uncharacterized protein n=1 Tax=Alternaria panax TaxID=48097 RepID=A0AAD4NPC6_9PLEO|nr:hypothetical protein G6011_11085 [Alternaria panax]
MEPEALQWLGWSYASRLYDHLKLNNTLTFQTWSLFRKAFPEDIDLHSTFRVYDRDSEGLLPSVVDRLAKLDIGILTFLCIRTVDMTVDQLVSLNAIKTLAALALEIGRNTRRGNERETLTMQSLRDWGRSVGESGAFKNLRVLLIDGCNTFLARFVLKCVSAFPSLNIVGIFGPTDSYTTKPYWGDWRQHIPSNCCNETTSSSGWGSSKTTITSDMRQLYDVSLELSQDVPTGDGTCRSLSMYYIQHSMPDPTREIAWFIRELKDESVRPVKRIQEDKPRLNEMTSTSGVINSGFDSGPAAPAVQHTSGGLFGGKTVSSITAVHNTTQQPRGGDSFNSSRSNIFGTGTKPLPSSSGLFGSEVPVKSRAKVGGNFFGHVGQTNNPREGSPSSQIASSVSDIFFQRAEKQASSVPDNRVTESSDLRSLPFSSATTSARGPSLSTPNSVKDSKAADSTLDAILAKAVESTGIPSGEHIRIIYAGTDGPCGARRMMVDFYTYEATGDLMRAQGEDTHGPGFPP